MRKLAFIIANSLTKLFKQNHRFRFLAFYILQMAISQSTQLIIIFSIGVFLGIVKYILITFLFFYISKLIFGGYHASSFEACTIMSSIIIIIPSYIASLNIFIGVFSIILLNFLASTSHGEHKLNKISGKIDLVFKKLRRREHGLKNGHKITR